MKRKSEKLRVDTQLLIIKDRSCASFLLKKNQRGRSVTVHLEDFYNYTERVGWPRVSFKMNTLAEMKREDILFES